MWRVYKHTTISIRMIRTHHDGARGQKDEEDVVEEEARQKEDGGLEALEGDRRLCLIKVG